MNDLLPRLSEHLPPDLYASMVAEFKQHAPRQRESYRNQYLIAAAHLLTGKREDRAKKLSAIAARWSGRDSKDPVLHCLFLARQFGKIPGKSMLKIIFGKTTFGPNIVANSGENEAIEPSLGKCMMNYIIEIFDPMPTGAVEYMQSHYGPDWRPRRYQFPRRVLELLALATDRHLGSLRLRCAAVAFELFSEPRMPPTESELLCHFVRKEIDFNDQDGRLLGLLGGAKIYDLLIQHGLRSEHEDD